MTMLAEPFTPPPPDAPAILDRRLSFARAMLIRRHRAQVAAGAIRSAAAWGMAAAFVAAIAAFARLTGWINLMPIFAAIGLWAAAWTWIFIRAVWNASRYQLGLMQTAQRLDLALACQNRLSSALEFRQQGAVDGFRRLAIEDAIGHLPSPDAILRALPQQQPVARLLPKLLVLAISAAAIILMLRLHPHVAGSIAGSIVPDALSASSDAAHHGPARKNALDEAAALAHRSGEPQSIPAGQREAFAAKNPTSGNDPHPASPQSIPADAGAGLQQSPASGADRKMGNAASPRAIAADSNTNQNAHPALPQLSDADMQPGASGRSSGAGQTASLSGMGQSQDHSPEKGASQTSAGNSASRQANENSKDAKSSQSSQSAQNQNGSRQSAGGQGGQNKDSTGGQGSGSGTSGAKKSRGAGTGLLGVRTSDLFTGRDLPGPDQHSSVPTAPIPQDDTPAAPAPAPDRREDEAATDITQISPEDDALINDYFSQLHHPESPSPLAPQTNPPAGQ